MNPVVFDIAHIIKYYNPLILTISPTYDQQILGVVCALREWHCYIEGSKKITAITDHATLRHIPTQDMLGRRHALWMADLSPNLAIVPQTNKPALEILYRKGSQNEAAALSRHPDLQYYRSRKLPTRYPT